MSSNRQYNSNNNKQNKTRGIYKTYNESGEISL